jgi:3-oxoacyl-[acyl-carrier protein] reductase
MSDTATAPAVSTVGPRLTGKTSIITGGASGMGLAAVERFLAEGGNVVAVDINDDNLERLASAHAGDDALVTTRADVTDQAAIDAVVADPAARFGSVDVYFNNAGAPLRAKPVMEITDSEWDLMIDVNLKAIFVAARAVVPVMREQGGGAIIITASMAGIRPRPNLSAYSAAKGGAVHLGKALAIELASDNIRVNSVCPVAADTPMLAQFGPGDHVTANKTPLGRLCTPEDVAATALWLASDDGGFITGLAIPVDGGRSI